MKIAVLGATGFLGKHLVRAIIRDTSLGVLAVSRTPPTSSTPGLQIIHPRELSEALPSVDVIVNCAVDYGRTSHIGAYVANLEWPLSVIKQASQLGVSFVNINTFYGKFPLALYSPLRTYSLTKALLELTGPELYAREKKRAIVRILTCEWSTSTDQAIVQTSSYPGFLARCGIRLPILI